MDVFYVVDVHFSTGAKLCVIPFNWLLESEKKVYFPPYKSGKAKASAMNQESPSDSTWKNYDVTVHGKFSSFREANVQMSNFENYGKFVTNEDPAIGRGHRGKAAPNKFTPNESSSEEESFQTSSKELDSSNLVNTLRKPPKEPSVFLSGKSKSKIMKKVSKFAGESKQKRVKKANELSTTFKDKENPIVSSSLHMEKSSIQPELDCTTEVGSGSNVSQVGDDNDNSFRTSSTKEHSEDIQRPSFTEHNVSSLITVQPGPSCSKDSSLTTHHSAKDLPDENANTIPWNTQYWAGTQYSHFSQNAFIPQWHSTSELQQSTQNSYSDPKSTTSAANYSQFASDQQALPWHGLSYNDSRVSEDTTNNAQIIDSSSSSDDQNDGERTYSNLVPTVFNPAEGRGKSLVGSTSKPTKIVADKKRKSYDPANQMLDIAQPPLRKPAGSRRTNTLVLLKNQEKILKLLESQNESLESPSTSVSSGNLKDTLSVQTMEQFRALNKSLRDNDRRNEFVQYVRQLGAGEKTNEATRFVWKHIIKDSVARNFNWLGNPRKNVLVQKKGLCRRRITTFILDGLRLNPKLQALTLKDYTGYTKDWFRHAPKRDDDEKKRQSTAANYDSDSEETDD